MAFLKKLWVPGRAGGTPFTAADQNRLEQGIDDLYNGAYAGTTSPAVEAWRVMAGGTPGVQGNWTNYGAPYEAAAYCKDPAGWVHMKGLLKNVGGYSFGAASANLLSLPAGYRPGARRKLPCPGFDAGAGNCIFHVMFDQTGMFWLDSATPGGANGAVGAYVFLDNIHFRAEA